MTYVIAAPCVADYSCVEVCPVDCIHPMPDESGFDDATQLYINPNLCVDCDACREACPVNAIFAQDQLPAKWHHYSAINAAHFQERVAISSPKPQVQIKMEASYE